MGFSRFRDALSALAILAFVLRSFVPAGYMPDVRKTASGAPRVSMTICTGMGPLSVQVPAQDVPAQDGGQHTPPAPVHQLPCPFSGAFAKGLPVAIAFAPDVAPKNFYNAWARTYITPRASFDVYFAQGPPAV